MDTGVLSVFTYNLHNIHMLNVFIRTYVIHTYHAFTQHTHIKLVIPCCMCLRLVGLPFFLCLPQPIAAALRSKVGEGADFVLPPTKLSLFTKKIKRKNFRIHFIKPL